MENYAALFLMDMGRSLISLDDGGGEPEFMRDGIEIQRVIAFLHGA